MNTIKQRRQETVGRVLRHGEELHYMVIEKGKKSCWTVEKCVVIEFLKGSRL